MPLLIVTLQAERIRTLKTQSELFSACVPLLQGRRLPLHLLRTLPLGLLAQQLPTKRRQPPIFSVSGRGSQGGTISDAELTRDEMTVATSVSGAATPVGTMEMSFDFEPLDYGSRESSEPRDNISLFEYQR